MALVLLVMVVALFGWLLWRAGRGPLTSAKPSQLDDQRGHKLVEALFRNGVELGYKRAWSHQAEAELTRVQAFTRRRTNTMVSSTVAAAVSAALPLGAALNILPQQSAWLPALAQWQWLLLALAAALFFVGLGAALIPRDYRRYSATRLATDIDVARLTRELNELIDAEAAEQLNAMKSYLTALSNERFADGQRHSQAHDPASIQTRISSAANAAYVQGRNDGATEAHAQVGQLTTEAYLRGVNDGERTATTKLEGRIRAEREAAYQSGYRVGLSEGRAAAAKAAAQATTTTASQAARAPRPRTRAEALAILDLTEGAQAADIERRYRELRTAVHPDRIRSQKMPRALVVFAEEQFKLVGEAYDILQRA